MFVTAQTALAGQVFLIAALPISIWVAYNDMARMKIPNLSVMALTIGFVVLGLFVLPLPEYGIRLLQLVIVLAIGFVLNLIGGIGAGDAKFAAAMAPFIARQDLNLFLLLFAATVLAAFATHRLLRRSTSFRSMVPDWESWTNKDFPMGLALGGGLIFYLLIVAFGSA